MHLCVLPFFLCIFFFKQKTAYDMRISDWSSDVCSSDLLLAHFLDRGAGFARVFFRDFDLEELALTDTCNIREAKRTERAFDGLTLRVEHTVLQHHFDAGHHWSSYPLFNKSGSTALRFILEENAEAASDLLISFDQSTHIAAEKIGRASCRERVCQYV